MSAEAGPSPAIGGLLRHYREAAGLSQNALAGRAGLSVRALRNLERGANRPYPDTLRRLSDALDLAPPQRDALMAALLRRTGAPDAPSLSSLPEPHLSPAAAADTGAPRPAPAVSLPPIAGRAGELAVVGRYLAGNAPPVLLFAGEPGIGKSRLLVELAARARVAGWTVLAGSAHRHSGQGPYAPLLTALKSHLATLSPARLGASLQGCAWLVRLLPELTLDPAARAALGDLPTWTVPPAQERRLMFEAAARFLANVAGPAGTLLVLDDLQWADADALDLLATLLRHPSPTVRERGGSPPTEGMGEGSLPPSPAHGRGAGGEGLRVAGAYRDTEVGVTDPLAVLLADLGREGRLTRLPLAPLAAGEARAVLAGLLSEGAEVAGPVGSPGDDEALVERLLRRASGIPYVLVSYAEGLRAGAAAADLGAPGDVPWDVAETIRQRAAALSEAARDLLATAAVVGGATSRAVLLAVAAMMGRAEREALRALDDTVRARLLEEDGPVAYRFGHDLIHEVVAADLGAARRATLHRRVAEALEGGSGAPPVEALAYHYGQAGDEEKAVAYLARAGERALALHANAEAEGYYRELAARLDGLGRPVEAAGARERLGAVLTIVARYDEALAVLERAAEDYRAAGDPEGLARAVAGIGQAHAERGTARAAMERLTSLLDDAPAHGFSSRALATLYNALARLCNLQGRYDAQLAAEAAVELAGAAGDDGLLLLAGAAGDDGLLLLAESQRGTALVLLGRFREALLVLEAALPRLEAAGDLALLGWTLISVSVARYTLGEFERAGRSIARASEPAARVGDPVLATFVAFWRGMVLFVAGAWDEARAWMERARRAAGPVAASWALPYPAYGLGHLSLVEGQPAAAHASLQQAIAVAAQTGDSQPLCFVHTALAEHDLLEGRPDAARARLEPLLDRPDQPRSLVTLFLPLLAWAYHELGEEDRADATAEEAVAYATGEPMRLLLVDGLRVRALLALRRGRWREAMDALDAALALARAMPYPYAEAKALYVYGLLHVARGEPEQARARLDAALTILARLGERAYAARAEQVRAALRASPDGVEGHSLRVHLSPPWPLRRPPPRMKRGSK